MARPLLSDYQLLSAGKVRQLYRIDDAHLLMVTSDRISAFDHILSTPIPDKGRVLTAMSLYFFDAIDVPNHVAGPLDDPRIPAAVVGRALVVDSLQMLPVECVVRGYLTGSGLADYRSTGAVCGIELPAGLTEGSKLPEIVFTPAYKAPLGEHDENIDYDRVVELVGADVAAQLRERTIEVYRRGSELAAARGIILADTKFEFGLNADGELILADEVLTPDSSRYWDAADWSPGTVADSFDKQIVRNWLTGADSGWDRASDNPPPPLPPQVIDQTRERYIEAYERITGQDFAALPGGPEVVEPPVAKQVPAPRTHHGDTFVDPYEWLRDKDNPEVLEYLKAQNRYTDAETADLAALRQQLFTDIKDRTQETDMSVPSRRGDYWYYARSEAGKQYGIQCRVRVSADSSDDLAGWTPPTPSPEEPLADEEIVFDSNVAAAGHDFFSLGAASVSVDGTLLAYSTDTIGNERYTLRFRNLATGQDFPDEIPDTAAGVLLSPDGRYAFYETVDDAWRPDKIWRHEIGSAAPDVLILHEPDEQYWVGIGSTRSRRYLVISIGSKITTELRVLAADNPTGEFEVVVPRVEGVEANLEHAVIGGADYFLITHNDDATNFAVDIAAVTSPLDRRPFIPHRPEVRVEGIDALASHLVLSYRKDALAQLSICELPTGPTDPTDLQFEPLSFEAELFTVGLGGNAEWDTPVLRVGYTSFVEPTEVFDIVLATGARIVRKRQQVLGDFDPNNYVQERVWATAEDGVQIPISLVYRRGVSHPAPTLLYGYGSYESSIDPAFSIARLNLLDRGMIFAVAHVRGGGELGRTWYDDGKTLTKRNTFTDFVAAAAHLVDTGVTTPQQQVAEGGSAGGLLVGAVANLAPHLFNGILAVVPFVDPVRSILDPSLPLTVIEWDEWGNPLADPEVYRYMSDYAPYQNVRAVEYPAILAISSLHDTRVLYVEPTKWVARLQELTTGEAPILLQTEMSAGHGGVSGRYDRWRQVAFEQAWVLRQAGAVS